jgi:hypothetical protein
MRLMAIVMLGCAAYGAWYVAVGGKRLNEEQVRDLYQQYHAAFEREDAKAVCDMYDDKISGQFSSTSKAYPVKESLDKASACSAVADFYETKHKLEEKTGHALETNFDVHVQSIELSADRQTATVEVLTEMRIGTEQASIVDMRVQHTDKVTKNLGKARFLQSDGSASFFH